MISGAHVIVYSNDAEADRVFFRDVLGFKSVDAGHGWLIFKLPPAELAVHPADDKAHAAHAGHRMVGAVLFLMCKDLKATMRKLKAAKVECTEVAKEQWGIRTTIKLPSGGELGLYQPTHKKALSLKSK